MSATLKINDMPQTQASIRQNQALMEYMQLRDNERNAALDGILEAAITRESLLETSIKGALMDRSG